MMTRRQWAAGVPLGLAAAESGLSAAATTAASRITAGALETFVVHVNARGNWVLARLGSSAGLTGIGEASHGGKDDIALRYVHQSAEMLKGRSIFDIEWLREQVKPEFEKGGSNAACALSALEQCSWDIIGQALNLPVYKLFGGALRTAIRIYANINRSAERSPAGFAAMAERAVQAGFDAVKLAPWDDMPSDLSDAAKVEEVTELGIDRATAVRKAIGPQRDLLLDAHSKFDVERGLKLIPRVAPLNLFWLEEVTPVSGLPAIRKAEQMPTAGGESLYGAKAFFPYIAAASVNILMPDVKYSGGMLELKKVGSLGDAAGLKVSPHGPASPVGNAAAAQVCATMPNFLILEFSYGEVPWREELIDPPEDASHGRLMVSERPGLGIRLNERTAAKYKAG